MKLCTQILLGIFSVLGIIIGSVVFLVIFFQEVYPKLDSSSKYKDADCLILSYNPITNDCGNKEKCKKFQATISVVVTKLISDESYTADANKKKNAVFKTEDQAREWQNGFVVNSTTDCYYHKKDNLDVVFDKGNSKKNIGKPIALAVILCVILSLAGPVVAFIIYWIVKNNNSNLPRDMSKDPSSGWSWSRPWRTH